ncbi:MAG: Flp pilus assembly complex ATPase component TadA [Bifidobacteriaceae bacterium]|jgi:type IV pilus assembly protein PilB|nr:Flp pilus assembly complex ATPase component TadA [Bifidobacteriaceae bacterium]
MSTAHLAEVLLDRGLVAPDQLLTALDREAATGDSLAGALIDAGALSEEDTVRILAEQAGLEYVDLDGYAVDRAATATIPAGVAKRHHVLPVAFDGDVLILAMAEPGDIMALDDVQAISGHRVRAVVSHHAALGRAIARWMRSDEEIDHLGFSIDHSATPDHAEQAGPVLDVIAEDSPVVRYVNLLISQAIADGASDIHLEPAENELRVRYRIDGVLHETQSAPKSVQSQVISRIKILSDLDIAERRRPQDGRASVSENGKTVDLRVATLPTVWGEKVVMRILDTAGLRLDLTDLEFSPENLRVYEQSFRRPHGMILVTGPTGSGKSTTLYATLNAIARPEINIITIEDPVEYRMDGINQVQVNPKSGLTFAAALRSIVRSDPDVVLIGEIRDRETAQIAIEAALTGHLVLSTLHTNDAPSAVTRLTEMGIEPFLVGVAVDCVVAQRLVRRLCQRCRENYAPTEAELRIMGFADAQVGGEGAPDALYRPVGCPACAHTGYRGRLALHEVMPVAGQIEAMTISGASGADVARAAIGDGMTTLKSDGWSKVIQGTTALEEVLRVVAA